jgi:hypothetical protein
MKLAKRCALSKTNTAKLRAAIGIACGVAVLAMTSLPIAAEAQQARSKTQRSAANKAPVQRVASRSGTDESGEPIKGLVGLRDRSTINHANGRLNGKEFFERMQEWTGGLGQ